MKKFPYHINDPEFANALVDSFLEIGSNISQDFGHQQNAFLNLNQDLPKEGIPVKLPGYGSIYSSPKDFPEARPGYTFLHLQLYLIVSWSQLNIFW